MKSLLILLTSIILWNNVVKAQPPCVNGHTNTDLSTSLSAGLYYIDTDVYVTSDITITDAELLVAGNVTIYVQSGVTLTLKGVHIYGCDEMWQGIVLDQEAKIVCNAGATHDNTLIEDADVAIKLYPVASFPYAIYYYDWAISAGINVVDIKNTIFNRNRIGIDFYMSRFYYGGTTYPTPSDYYPVEIYNTIFTCRDIPFTIGSNVWVDYEVFKNTTLTSSTSYPNTPASNSSPYINNSVYSPNNSHAYLKYPYNSTPTKSEIGIYAESWWVFNGMYKIGFEDDGINTNNVTLFDNHDYAIKMLTTDLQIANCTFQNTPDANTNPTTGVFVGTVYEERNYSLFDTRANAGKPHNAFFDCGTAISVAHYLHLNIENNDIRSSKTQDLANVQHGLEGISVLTTAIGLEGIGHNNIVTINNNELVNIAYPITVRYEDIWWVSDDIELSTEIEVNDNWIALYRQSGSINDVLSGYLTEQAINLEVIVPYPYQSTIAHEPLRCNRNQIQSARQGIRISGWDGKDVRVIDNNVLVNNNTLHGYNNAQGIVLQGNIPQRQYGNLVYKNVVSGHYNYPGYVNNINNTIRLIQMNNGLDYDVRCNQANGTARFNMTFSGIMPNVIFGSNIMSPDIVKGRNRALTLDNAIIGTQGTTANACGNNYDDDMNYAIFGTLKTFCINSDATQSRMYVYNTPGNFQNPDNFSGGGGPSYTPYAFANGSLQWANNQTTETCAVIANKSSNSLNNASTVTPAAQFTDTTSKLQEMVNTATGNINIKGTDSALRLYVAQQQLYRFLRNPNGVATKSTQLQQFVAAKDTGSFGRMNQIAAALAKRDTALVQQLLNTWNKTNRVDSNYAQFFTWTLQRGLGQSVNLAAIEALAQQCPQTDGNVVFLSQNLYNAITNKHRIFTTSCELRSTEFPDSFVTNNYVAKPANKIIENNTLSVYPNPANNDVRIKGNNIAYVEMYNMYGARVYTSQRYNYKGKTIINIPLKNLAQGMYILKVYDRQNKSVSRKLIKQ